MALELRHLRAFLAVVRHGTVTRAAAALRLTQPTVSMILGDLARELGNVRPFERDGRSLRLTAAGQALLERAGPLLEELERLPAAVQEAAGGAPRGPVRVGAGEAAVLYLLPPAIRAFRARFPAVDVVVRNQPGEDTAAMLRAGELDFGLRGWEAAPRGVAYRPTLRFERLLIAPPGHPVLRARPLDLAAVAAHPLVMPWPRSTVRRRLERALDAARLPHRVALEAGGWEVVKRYVGLGFGIGIVPAFCLRRGDRLGTRRVTSLLGADVYGIASRPGRPLSGPAAVLAALVSATARGRPAAGGRAAATSAEGGPKAREGQAAKGPST